ncbi:Ig-like domain-containing protein [Pontiellaceae bacterium B12227]|nr:Ig-like domain-containing protein [Pontiellaceae bacterium B12227]
MRKRWLGIGTVLTGVLLAATGQATLVAEWKFDDGSGTSAVDSISGYDGTMLLETEWTNNAVSGSALNFANTNYMTIPSGAFGTITNELTLSMWVFGNGMQPDNGFSFYAQDGSSNKTVAVNLPHTTKDVVFDAGNTGSNSDRLQKKQNTNSAFKGYWNHWVFSKDVTNGVMKIYLNGGLFASGSGKPRNMAGIADATIGGGISARPYRGLMDEVRLYDSVLTDAEVSSLFDSYSYSVTNLLPAATAQSVSTLPETPLDITLTASDPEGIISLDYTVVDMPANGMLTGTAPSLIYTPTSGYAGPDSFTFTVNDGHDESALGTVSISVTNYTPVADAIRKTTPFGTPVEITLSGSDLNGTTNLFYHLVSQPVNGTLTTNVSIPDLIYTPTNGFAGDDSFTYTVSDGEKTSEPATVSITVQAEGTHLSFTSLSTALAGNTLKVNGGTGGLTVTGVATNNGYVYSVVYTGEDYDGDTTNDTLSFSVNVMAVSNSVVDHYLTTHTTTTSGTVTSISTDAAAVTAPSGEWTVGGNMADGETLIFTVTDMSSSAGTMNFEGFNLFRYRENSGFNHGYVVGDVGLSNRVGRTWTGPNGNESIDPTETLYVTGDRRAAGNGAEAWGIQYVNFDFLILEGAATSVGDISMGVVSGGTAMALSWPTLVGSSYGVQATDDLVIGTWSNIITGVTGTGGDVSVTNLITEDALFMRAYVE